MHMADTAMEQNPTVIKSKRIVSPEHLQKLWEGRDKARANKLAINSVSTLSVTSEAPYMNETRILLTLNSTEDYSKLNEFLKGTDIHSKLISVHEAPDIANPEIHKYIYDPNPGFKEFCGKEWLNYKGHISLHSAMDAVVMYAKHRFLILDTHIELDERLRDALDTDSHEITIMELQDYLTSLFKKI
jgi:hypothetical protein